MQLYYCYNYEHSSFDYDGSNLGLDRCCNRYNLCNDISDDVDDVLRFKKFYKVATCKIYKAIFN